DPCSGLRSHYLDPDEFPLHAIPLDSGQRRLAEIVRLLVFVHGPSEPDLVRVVVEHDVRTVVQDARLDPTNLRRGDRADVVLRPGGDDRVPESLAELRIAQVQLVAALGAPARPRDDARDSVELRLP